MDHQYTNTPIHQCSTYRHLHRRQPVVVHVVDVAGPFQGPAHQTFVPPFGGGVQDGVAVFVGGFTGVDLLRAKSFEQIFHRDDVSVSDLDLGRGSSKKGG